MQKKYALFLNVLRTFDESKILDDCILVGSWCMHFYQRYFPHGVYQPSIRTTDVDFLVAHPSRLKKKIHLPSLLEKEGFILTFNSQGYMRMEHPELIIEFLVPEKGRGTDKPYPLPSLGINAQALRFLDYLAEHAIVIASEGFKLKLPHPAAFGLHKLIVMQRRKKKEKAEKEQREALGVLRTLIAQGEADQIRAMFYDVPASWRKKVLHALNAADETELLNILK